MTRPKPESKPGPVAENGDLASARRVLELEARGLGALAAGLDPSFGRALDLIAGARGRVVVTGMGKSGHVGRKIAATLASTGTPALYVNGVVYEGCVIVKL